MATGQSVSDPTFTAFSAAATYRSSDKRGGANGGRLALAPQKNWAVNRRTIPVIEALRGVAMAFNGKSVGKQVSLADLIVLRGCSAVERALADAGHEVTRERSVWEAGRAGLRSGMQLAPSLKQG